MAPFYIFILKISFFTQQLLGYKSHFSRVFSIALINIRDDIRVGGYKGQILSPYVALIGRFDCITLSNSIQCIVATLIGCLLFVPSYLNILISNLRDDIVTLDRSGLTEMGVVRYNLMVFRFALPQWTIFNY